MRENQPGRDNRPQPDDTAGRLQHALIGDCTLYTLSQLAERAGVTVEFARAFWRAMAFPNVKKNEIVFGEADVVALREIGRLVQRGIIDEDTAISLLRAQSHMTDRMVLWQFESLVEEGRRRYELDDVTARLMVLDRLQPLIGSLERQLSYAWRRQFSSLTHRQDLELRHESRPSSAERMPLDRALGFVDMVAYTRRSTELGPNQLSELVRRFEYTCRDVITSRGARIVKTIGDATLYISEDLETAAKVVVELVRALQDKEGMLPVRASLVWGGVLSRSGDVFGPVVNLSSRLVDIAAPGTILTDVTTRDALLRGKDGDKYSFLKLPVENLHGMGEVEPIELAAK